MKTYNNGDTAITYAYDQPACLGLSACDNIGHRTGMTDAAGSEAWSYSVLLNTTVDQRTNGTLTKTATSVSNLDGSQAGLTYPSGRVVTYSPGGAGRSLSVTDTANNYATGALYAPPGLLSSVANGASLISTFYYNKRLQPCRISTKSSGTAPATCTDTASIGNVLDFSYNFSLGAGDNGNVSAIVNNRFPNRSQNFTYDTLNRILTATTAATHATDPTDCWGEAYVYDSPAGPHAWGNLVQINPASSAYTGCTQEGFNQSITANNQISGRCYDAAGNLLANAACGAATYIYNAENQIISTAGVTYKYDGDGKRVSKSSNKTYWYGGGGDPITETDASGNVLDEYIFFDGKRIARRDSAGNVDYYEADHLGTSRVVTGSAGSILDQSDFYPFGGERIISASSGNTYKFTGKERDSESGLDMFGARYYGSSLGRFMTPDWAAKATAVPYAVFGNPQSLNLYSYVGNNPLAHADPDGHCWPAQSCFQALANAVNNFSNKVFNSSGNSSPTVAALKTFGAGVLADTVKMAASPLTMGTATGTCMGGSGCSAGKTALAVGGDVLKGAAIAGGVTAVAGVAGRAADAVDGALTTASEASTPVGRLGSPMNTEGMNAAETINGTDYSGHAIDRMQSVGLTPSVVEDTIQTGVPGPGNTPGTATLTTDQLKVVMNSDKQVVTVTPQ